VEIPINSPYITLGQLLKLVNLVGSGGEVKAFLRQEQVLVNGQMETRRGRKLYPGDEVRVADQTFRIKATQNAH
jgi:ribosome-associated protein